MEQQKREPMLFENITIEQKKVDIDTDRPPAIQVPENTDYSILSLGAGVQSSAMALMFAKGVFEPMPDVAIFADTQAEPPSVYQWLDWLENELPFPVERVTEGNIATATLKPRTTKDGREYTKYDLPVYTLNHDGSRGMAKRQCTQQYKIKPLYNRVRELYGKKVKVTTIMGISWDEIQRMKDPYVKWVVNRYPLIERRVTRDMCIRWMAQEGYPRPPRSACVFCPYHNNTEWARLKNEEPDQFDVAIKYERQLQQLFKNDSNMRSVPYLHGSCKPLDEIDFTNQDCQEDLFGNECEGMCGI
jgi:hypothetical protein